MKFFMLSVSFFVLLFGVLQATVFITHGLGTEGIKYYQNSKYIDLIKESAQSLGHEVVCIPWLDVDSPEKGFAGILPQERISSAVKIAKEILNEIKSGNEIILIGHGYGGQVMACATRLINPENTKLTDSFIYELIYSIKNLGQDTEDVDQVLTRTITPEVLLKTLIWGWKISKTVFNAIESSNVVNLNLTKLIKQNISLKFIDEIKSAWIDAFSQVQTYKTKLFKNMEKGFDCKNSIQIIYTIGTANNGDSAFLPDMKVVQNHVNFYSVSDSSLSISGLSILGKKLASRHPRTINIEVLFEPTKSFAPKHAEFCGNVLMAPWILQIPNGLKTKNLGGFEKFEWGKSGIVTFYTNMVPSFKCNN
ncbi:MAG: hypothetical protein V1646_01265 [bacterium]